MREDFQKQSWFNPLTNKEKELLFRLIYAQEAQGNMEKLQSQPNINTLSSEDPFSYESSGSKSGKSNKSNKYFALKSASSFSINRRKRTIKETPFRLDTEKFNRLKQKQDEIKETINESESARDGFEKRNTIKSNYSFLKPEKRETDLSSPLDAAVNYEKPSIAILDLRATSTSYGKSPLPYSQASSPMKFRSVIDRSKVLTPIK